MRIMLFAFVTNKIPKLLPMFRIAFELLAQMDVDMVVPEMRHKVPIRTKRGQPQSFFFVRFHHTDLANSDPADPERTLSLKFILSGLIYMSDGPQSSFPGCS